MIQYQLRLKAILEDHTSVEFVLDQGTESEMREKLFRLSPSEMHWTTLSGAKLYIPTARLVTLYVKSTTSATPTKDLSLSLSEPEDL